MTRASDLAKLLGAGATINDGTTITTADNTVQLSLTSTDADENSGPQIDLYRNSASPADNDFKPGFSSELMLKDLTLSQMAAEDVNADTPMGDLAMKLYKTFVEEENGTGKDFSAMLPRFEKKPRN